MRTKSRIALCAGLAAVVGAAAAAAPRAVSNQTRSTVLVGRNVDDSIDAGFLGNLAWKPAMVRGLQAWQRGVACPR